MGPNLTTSQAGPISGNLNQFAKEGKRSAFYVLSMGSYLGPIECSHNETGRSFRKPRSRLSIRRLLGLERVIFGHASSSCAWCRSFTAESQKKQDLAQNCGLMRGASLKKSRIMGLASIKPILWIDAEAEISPYYIAFGIAKAVRELLELR